MPKLALTILAFALQSETHAIQPIHCFIASLFNQLHVSGEIIFTGHRFEQILQWVQFSDIKTGRIGL